MLLQLSLLKGLDLRNKVQMSNKKFIYIAVETHIVACDKENRARMGTPLGLLTEKDCNSSAQINFFFKKNDLTTDL